jgi:hypothetical protein
MAAFPGILQSPFVVATDRAIGRSQVGSLTAIDVALASRRRRPKPPISGGFTPLTVAAIQCMSQGETSDDMSKCAAAAAADPRCACLSSCQYRWNSITQICELKYERRTSASDCDFFGLNSPSTQTPELP